MHSQGAWLRRSELESGWHALYTRHQHEKAAAQALTLKGLEIFLPLYVGEHQWKDRVKRIALPLFPGYVFLRSGNYKRLDVLTTPGIHSLVLTGASPAVIPSCEIEAIRRAVENGFQPEPHPFLKFGDLVRVNSGPLQGFQGTLVRKKNKCRLVFSVEILERAVAMEIDSALVDPIAPHRSLIRPNESSGRYWARV